MNAKEIIKEMIKHDEFTTFELVFTDEPADEMFNDDYIYLTGEQYDKLTDLTCENCSMGSNVKGSSFDVMLFKYNGKIYAFEEESFYIEGDVYFSVYEVKIDEW